MPVSITDEQEATRTRRDTLPQVESRTTALGDKSIESPPSSYRVENMTAYRRRRRQQQNSAVIRPLRPPGKMTFRRRELALDFFKMNLPTLPIETSDPLNARILAVSEDRIQGFQRDPLGEIARQSGVELPAVIARIQAMLRAGTVRRVRQTLLATNLAQGALVAWQVPLDRLEAAFDYMFQKDPCSGHVVIRSTDAATPGSNYKLWTTLKVPQAYSMRKHCEFLSRQTGAGKFILLPAKRLFALGVGHVRRRGMEPGSRADAPAEVIDVAVTNLNDLEWRILTALKREFEPEDLASNLWEARAKEAGVPLETFYEVAEDFNRRNIIGRFSTFLEHVKPLASGARVTRLNPPFHRAAPPGRATGDGPETGPDHLTTHPHR